MVAWYLNRAAPDEVDVASAVEDPTGAPAASSEMPAAGGDVAARETGPVRCHRDLTAVTTDRERRDDAVQREIPLESARAERALVGVGGSTATSLADLGVQAPSAPILLSVSDGATVELQLPRTDA